jgi:parvulin-like peptidyl-prolyl isomerase
MVMKKSAITVLTFAAVALVAFGGTKVTQTNANAGSPLDSLKSTVQKMKTDPYKDQVVATVGDFPVTKSLLATAIATLQSMHDLNHDGKVATEEDGYQLIKKEKAVEKAAKELGITVTDDEVREMVKQNKEGFEQHADANDRALMQSMIDAMGLTYDQYWNDFSIKQGKNQLIEMKLRQHFHETYSTLHKTVDPNEEEKAWNAYLDEITNKEVVTKK